MRKTLSLLGANVLFLLTMLLVITLGSTMQLFNLSLGLIATEVLLIALPTLLLLRARKVPLKAGLRLTPIPVLTALLCVLLGFATFMFSLLIEAVIVRISGRRVMRLGRGDVRDEPKTADLAVRVEEEFHVDRGLRPSSASWKVRCGALRPSAAG